MRSRGSKRSPRQGRSSCGAVHAASIGAGLVLAFIGAMDAAHAETIDTARDAAFGQSFVLRADTARQDGAVARLRGSQDAFLPTVSLLGSQPLDSKISYNPDVPLSTYGPDTTLRSSAKQYGISVDLPLFDGLQRWNTLQSSRTQVEAGQNLTLDARLQVMLDTATAYLFVMRDRKILDYRQQQLVNLQTIAKNVDAQLAVAITTRTDSALAASRVADAATGVDQATADLRASELEFSRLTGRSAAHLAPPRLPILPRTEAETADLARTGNPRLAAARLDARSAQYLADAAKGALLPQVGLQFTHGRQTDVTATLHSITETTTKLQIKIPLYAPGSIPKVAETSAFAQQKDYEAEDAMLRTVTAARIAFQRRASARAQTETLAARVKALRAAVHGYEVERGLGFRTVIDELNGRAELAQAEILLANSEAERDRLAFVVAAAIGQIDVPVTTDAPPGEIPPDHAQKSATFASDALAASRTARLHRAKPAPLQFGLRTGDAAASSDRLASNETRPPTMLRR